ncbi:MAG: single-stranded DNA-binding protein, partial [Acetobacteraceae bacterium]|nr:single-stranded DNA-binding protein [Acetobacteraceae bacterium]
MSGYLNRVTLIGNLGRDPEIRTTQAGNKIAGLSLATSETWTDKRSGDRVERTEWHRIVIFNEALADIAERYLRKGSKILVEGQLQTRDWTDNAGVKRYTTEIVLPRFGG